VSQRPHPASRSIGVTSIVSPRRYTDPTTGWSIVPPSGFALVATGTRTRWRGPGGLELLVETEASPRGTALGNWIDLHRRFARAPTHTYRLIRIDHDRLSGNPGALWEFELDGLHKVDRGINSGNMGYAVMISGPPTAFEKKRAPLEESANSFRLPSIVARATEE
jgi:hypothetical protein